MTYEGCGVASWKYQYQPTPPLKHGSGLCWLEKDEVKTYEPRANVFERFCHEAVYELRQKGGWEFMNERARIGYYWTDYNRKVAHSGNSSQYFDMGMVHVWIKAPQNIIPCPTKGRYGDHMIEDEENGLTHELCVKHLNTLQNMDCKCPLLSFFFMGELFGGFGRQMLMTGSPQRRAAVGNKPGRAILGGLLRVGDRGKRIQRPADFRLRELG